MRVGIVGINHKMASLKLRERLAKTCQRRFGPGHSVHSNHYFVLLSTCNRTEVYFSSEDLPATHTYILSILRQEVEDEFDQKLYSYFGQDCFLHLCRVSSGLDSAIIAETEIQGQVKTAYEAAVTYHRLPKALHYLFQKSMMTSKQIRTTLQLGRGMPNLEHAVLNCGKEFFSSLENVRILFIGVSDVNKKILNHFKEKKVDDITICNRSGEAACAVADSCQLQVLEWSRLAEWSCYDWLIVGTKAPDYLIKHQDLAYITKDKLIIDLSVPRNIDPIVGNNKHVTLYNIDQIIKSLSAHKHTMTDSLSEAEARIAIAAKQHVMRFLMKEASQSRDLAVGA